MLIYIDFSSFELFLITDHIISNYLIIITSICMSQNILIHFILCVLWQLFTSLCHQTQLSWSFHARTSANTVLPAFGQDNRSKFIPLQYKICPFHSVHMQKGWNLSYASMIALSIFCSSLILSWNALCSYSVLCIIGYWVQSFGFSVMSSAYKSILTSLSPSNTCLMSCKHCW